MRTISLFLRIEVASTPDLVNIPSCVFPLVVEDPSLIDIVYPGVTGLMAARADS